MKKSYSQLFKFLLVGVLNTGFGFGCYSFFVLMGLHYSMAVALSTALGVLFNFKSTGVFVFESKDNRLLLRFVTVYGVLYIINVVSIGFLVSFGLNDISAAAIVVAPIAIVSFVLQKKFVFSHE